MPALLHRILLSATCATAFTQVHALSLMQAYEAALVNDPIYRAAVSEKAAGLQYEAIGRSHLLPNVSANLSTNRNYADINTASQTNNSHENRSYTSLATSIQMRQPLYHPEGQARYRQGVAQTQASIAQFTVRSQDLIVRLVSLYAPAKYAEDQLALAIAQRDAYALQKQANQRLLALGEGTKTDVLETQARYDLSEVQILEARDNLVNARNALSTLVGQEVTTLQALAEGFQTRTMDPESFDAWKELALANNPEILAQRFALDIATQEVAKNQAGHRPRLDLLASTSKNRSDTTSTVNQNTNLYSFGLQLSVPIYSGGAVDAATLQAVANKQKAQAELDAKISQVLVELRKQYNLTLSSVPRIAAAQTALSSARLLVEATQKSVAGGVRTNVDVLSAQQQVQDAKRELALSRYNYLTSYTRLRYSAGTLSEMDLKQIAAYFEETK
jgi:outer membrane protein, protease secretion system